MNPKLPYSTPLGDAGAALLEFAMVVPIFILLLFPTVDIARYYLLEQKTIKTASNIADAITMSRGITTATSQEEIEDGAYNKSAFVRQFLVNGRSGGIVNVMMRPFGTSTPLIVNISSIKHTYAHGNVYTDYTPKLQWQFSSSRGFSSNTPAVGYMDNSTDRPNSIVATLPSNFYSSYDSMLRNEDLIAVEVQAQFEAITPITSILPEMGSRIISKQVFYRSRYGDLSYISPEFLP